jgi:hypothetical protein
MKEQLSTIYRRLKIMYAVSIAVSSILFIAVFLTNEWSESSSNTTLERYAILITLIGIPLALKLFHNRTKGLDNAGYIVKYQKQYTLRMAILEAVFLFNLISLHITGAKNFIFMIIITIFALVLCAPQKVNLEQDKPDNN